MQQARHEQGTVFNAAALYTSQGGKSGLAGATAGDTEEPRGAREENT